METLSMSWKERSRLEVLGRVRRGEVSLVKGAELMSVSYRQAKRLWSRYQAEGDAGLVHRLRGQPSNRQAEVAAKERALSLYREKYSDYGPTLAAECLAKEDELSLPVTSLRRWLTAAGLWQRRRKRKVHRRRRPRREQLGELVQMDGSHHDWFEGRRAWAVLMVMVDDATGRVTARFFENESWHSAASLFRTYTREQGLPRALYVDRHGIYRSDREPTKDEVSAGKEPQTQFGRALQQLGVELILARSPQAKGRVERMNGTLQDRLVKALRRAEISDLAAANAFLEATFLPEFNQQFGVAATKRGDLHRVVGRSCDLELVLSIQEERVVQNDYTLRWRNGFLQLDRQSCARVRPGDRVTVCQQLDGRLRVLHAKGELAWLPTRTMAARAPKKRSRPGPIGSNQGQRPSAKHPWRRDGIGSAAASVVGLACSAPVAALPTLRSPTPPRKPR